jgi:transposase
LREDYHYYSVPWQLKGKRVRVIYDERNVAIYYDNVRIVQHRRDYTPNDYTTLHTHMPPEHRHHATWDSDRFIRWAKSIGNNTEDVIKNVLKSRKHPEQAFKSCMGILNLVKKYGSKRLDKACERALHFGFHSYRRIKNILDRGMEEDTLTEQKELFITSHKNLRGSGYYK